MPRHKGRLSRPLAVAVAASLALAACGSAGTAASGGSGKGALTIGELLPFTGTKSVLSTEGVAGTAAGMYAVNSAGGVLGHKLTAASADDAGDAVDAVPALRQLLVKHPNFIVGPFSLSIMGVIREFDPNATPDFMVGGDVQLDHMQYPYVFRMGPSDSVETVAMATYAISKGLKRAAFIFDNSSNTQGFVAPLTASYEKQGGTVVANLAIVPDQSSYRSELTKVFAAKPDVVFVSFDQQTASTLFSEARSLGDESRVLWIGNDVLASGDFSKAFGEPQASQDLITVGAVSPPTGQAYQYFLQAYQGANHTSKTLPVSQPFYDAVIIAALAMNYSHSTDPKVWVKNVVQVTNPPGTKCYSYTSCLALLGKGQKINYQGAIGPDDFNTYHNMFPSAEIVSGFSTSGSLTQVGEVTAAQLAANAG